MCAYIRKSRCFQYRGTPVVIQISRLLFDLWIVIIIQHTWSFFIADVNWSGNLCPRRCRVFFFKQKQWCFHSCWKLEFFHLVSRTTKEVEASCNLYAWLKETGEDCIMLHSLLEIKRDGFCKFWFARKVANHHFLRTCDATHALHRKCH